MQNIKSIGNQQIICDLLSLFPGETYDQQYQIKLKKIKNDAQNLFLLKNIAQASKYLLQLINYPFMMIYFLTVVFETIFNRFVNMQQQSIKLSKTFICFSLILKSLLNISYLYEEYQPSYIYVCAILTRPQIFLVIHGFDYLMIVIILIYVIGVLIEQMPCRSYIAIFCEVLRVNGLNICFELCRGKYKLIPQTLLIFLFLNDQFFVQGTLNIHVLNFQVTKNGFSNKLLALMMSIQMVFYTNQLNTTIFHMFVTIHSALLFFHYAYNQPYKYHHMSLIMACIQLITFYLGVLKVTNIYSEFTAELVLMPFIVKIIWVNFEKHSQQPNDKNSIEELLIRSSILIQDSNYFEALKMLESSNDANVSILIKAKKQILYKSCLKEIQSLIYTNIPSHTTMAEAVNLLMESENQNNKIQSQIISLIKSKIQQLVKLHDSKFNIFWELMDYTKKTIKIVEELKKYYSSFPTNKTQAILGFFYSEIQNDFIASHKLFSIQALTEENNDQRRIISETFSNKVAYLIADYKNGLIIQKVSNNLETVIEYDSKQLIGKNVNCIIPPGIMEYHDQMVQEFLINGESKFLRSIQENFYLKDEVPYAIEFAIDINFVDELKFISFLQPTQSRPMIMIINSENIIQCVSQSLIQELNSLPIKNQPLNIFINNFELLSQKENFTIEHLKFTLTPSFSKRKKYQFFDTYMRVSYKLIYNQIVYQILRFEYFRKLSQKDSENQSYSLHQQLVTEENIQINVPYIQEGFETLQYNVQEENIQLFSSRSKISQNQYLIFSKREQFGQKLSINKNSIEQYNLNNHDNQEDNEQIQFGGIQGNDQASLISSQQGIRKSNFFKKYEILCKLNDEEHYSKDHLLLYLFLGLNIILYIILGSIELIEINQNLTNLASDIDLLQIKNLVFMPIESSLVTRYNILQYTFLLTANSITTAEFRKLTTYPRSNLALGYDQLSENIHQIVDKGELQQTINNINLEIYLYIDSGKGELYEINLRGIINILLNYQYGLKMAFQIDGQAQLDSTQVYFSQKNYRTLKDTFSTLNDEILMQTINRSNMMQQFITILSVITLILHFLLFFLICRFYHHVKIIYQKYVFLIMNIDKHVFDEEITRYQKLVNLLEKDPNNLFRYQNNIESIERIISKPHVVQGQKKIKVQKSRIEINLVKIRWIMIFIFSIVSINCVMTYYETSVYLSKYSATSKFYKDLSDVGTDIPTMYAQKELYYLKAPMTFFTSKDFEKIITEILQALNRTKVFSSKSFEYNQLLISDSFKSYYQEITQSDLCNYLPESIKNRSLEICPQIMQSNMKRGLNSILVYIINSIETEYEINKFTAKLSSPIFELEGAFILCQLINDLNRRFNKDLNQLTVDLLKSINTYNLVFLVVLLIVLYVGSMKLHKYFQEQNSQVRKLLYLTPRRTLLTDDAFERNSKALLITT